jgi:hypothetical protein
MKLMKVYFASAHDPFSLVQHLSLYQGQDNDKFKGENLSLTGVTWAPWVQRVSCLGGS